MNPHMHSLTNGNKKIFGQIFIATIVFLQVFGAPILVYGQVYGSDGSYEIDSGNGNWITNTINGNNQEQNQAADNFNTGPTQNPTAKRGVNPLYPAKGTPNKVSLENLGVDAASCIAAVMATRLVNGAFASIQETAERSYNAFWIYSLVTSIWGGGVAGSAAGAAINDTGSTALINKEIGFDIGGLPIGPSMDSISFCAKNVLMAYLQASIIKWVNEGFNEAAVFVEDFEKVINDVADLAFEKAIGEVNICGHLKASVDLSVLADLLRERPDTAATGRCTISYDKEFELVLSGESFNYYDFESIYSNPNNNALGAYLLTQSVTETNRSVYEKKVEKDLDYGNGFWPWKDPETGKTLTPGQVIEDKLLSALGLSDNAFVIADEMDEVVFMIFNQLIKTKLEDSLSI